jgi:hypothetical protein
MAGLVDSKENTVLDAILGDATHFPNPIYVGIMTAEPNDDGTGVVEPSGMAYERVSVDNNLTEWPAASGGQKSNASTITFPTATGDWGTITHFGIFDAISGGNLLAFGELNVSRVVWSADIFRFLADDLVVTLD